MSLCTLRAPASPRTHFRPIVVVKFNGRLEAFAMYINKAYQFEVDPRVQQAIDQGDVRVEFARNANDEVTEINLVERGIAGYGDAAPPAKRNISELPPV